MGKKIEKAKGIGKKAYQIGDKFLGSLVTAQKNIEKAQKKKKKGKSFQFDLPNLA